MFKAVRSYEDKSASNHTLSIKTGDTFCVLEKTNDTWWLASNQYGKVGYVLSSHLEALQQESTHDVVLQSIDRAIAAVYAASSTSTAEQQSVLRKLTQHKQSVLAAAAESKKEIKRKAPPPPPARASDKIKSPQLQQVATTKKHAPSPPVSAVKQLEPVKPETFSSNKADSMLPESSVTLGYVPSQIGQELMNKLLSQCHLTEIKSREIVESLLKVIGENIPQLEAVMEEIKDTLPDIQVTSDPIIDKLRLALANIKEIKEDGQQNNWAIEDDAEKISAILNEILECLIFGVLCSFTSKVATSLMTTVLPLELVQDISVHKDEPSNNQVVEVVSQNSCKVLSEKIMLLINRDEDPVRIIEEEETPNSVMKFLQDVFSREDTATTFLYTNDLMVLADIIARNLADLPPGAKARTDYLDLLLNVVSKSTYSETKPRGSEIVATLRRIEAEELPIGEGRDAAEFDKTIVARILSAHLNSLL